MSQSDTLSAADVIDYLEHLGAFIRIGENGPAIAGVPAWHEMDEDHRHAISAFRESVIEALGVKCEECRASVKMPLDADECDVIFSLCRRKECPWWRVGHPNSGPDTKRSREFEFWRRAQKQKMDSESIPQ